MRLASIPRPVLVALGLAGPALTGCGDDGETGSDEATVAGCLLCPPETCGDGNIPGPTSTSGTASGTDGATSTSGATSGEDDTLGPCLGPLPPESSSGTDSGTGTGTGTGSTTSDSTGADSDTGTGGMAAVDRTEIQRRLIDAGTLAPDVVDRLRRRGDQ